MALPPSTNPPRLSVLETTLVVPSPAPGPPECSLPLTFFDVFWLNSPPVERVFLYRLAPDADANAIVSNLKASLSQAIRAFYPLAGRLRATASGRYELRYQPGDGVSFTVAEYDALGVDELSADDPREVSEIAPLVPPLPNGDGSPVLAVQATALRGGRGLAVGVALHHAACDGASSTRFLHTWAAAARAENNAPPSPPVIDRTLMTDPRGLYDIFCEALPTADEMEYVKMCPDQMLATFTLSGADTRRVKGVVAREAARRGLSPPPRCSSLVATFGFIWSCYQRAKEEATSDATADQRAPTYLLFPVDHRSRMKPPLPEEYLGNCVGPALRGAPTDALGEAGAGGLYTACAAVAAAIDGALSGIGSQQMDSWMEQIREVGASGGGVLSVAGSPRFRVYEVDFGFGRPAKVEIVSVARTGAMAVAESRGCAGGMEVGISLPPDGMHRFRDCFHDAIAWLHNQ